MFRIFSKIFSFFVCIGSLLAILIVFLGYFIAQKATFSLFILATLFFGFIFIFELYNLFKENVYLKSFLLIPKTDFRFLLNNLGSLIFGGLCLYLGIAKVEDVSEFDKKLFLFGSFFFLIFPLSSFWFKLKGIKQYYALPKERRDEAEKKISFLSKIEPAFILIVTIIVFIFYLLTRK